MTELAPIFEKTYRDYLAQIGERDIAACAPMLGGTISERGLTVPIFGKPFTISPEGIVDPHGDRPLHAINVVLCKYVLMCPKPDFRGSDQWVTYKNFKNAAPFVGGFTTNAEGPVTKNFAGRLPDLTEASEKLGGYPPKGMDLPYDLVMRFDIMPKVPVILLFNDADEEFPAHCSMLFQEKVVYYLDPECLAIVGWLLADELRAVADGAQPSIM